VRYCLDADGTTIWREQQTWTGATAPAVPSGTACGTSGDGWPTKRVLVPNIRNGAGRPLFTYNRTDPTAVTEIAASVFVDPDPGHTPKEVALQSAVFLRNQNRRPTAAFDIQVSAGTYVLNASDSNDPEGRSLDLYWYDESRSDQSCGPAAGTTGTPADELPSGVPATGCIGNGLVFNYTPPTAGNHTLHVIARDPAGLTATSTSKTCNSTATGC
jgi:hypothetical protein